jgi:3',5'-cyclic AMP phosphodiesterase CpdA
VLIAHLSDLHLRDAVDARAFERQLDRIVAGVPDHLVISGDLLDRWRPRLLARVLDALASRNLLTPERATIIHGNHDLASSGGHPRSRADLPRLVLRFWDPPPIVAARRRRFYRAIEGRAAGAGTPTPFAKDLGEITIAAIDTVPLSWVPLTIAHGRVQVRHGIGCVRRSQAEWLSRAVPRDKPVLLVLHHYPLAVPPFVYGKPRSNTLELEIGMEIPAADRRVLWKAAHSAGVRLMLCGHVHRARLEWHDGIAVGLQGQSGAAWAGRSIGWYRLEPSDIRMELERTA